MKKGFTLAEVLITLGIIGVVAALTAPALVQNVGNAKVGPTLAKIVSTIENANQQILNEEEATDLSKLVGSGGTGEYMELLSKHISGSSYISVGEMTYLKYFMEKSDLKIDDYDGKSHDTMSIVLQDFRFSENIFIGINVFNLEDYEPKGSFKGNFAYIYIDINGADSPPNNIGKDIFKFYIDKNGKVIPLGSSTHAWLTNKTSNKYTSSGDYACNETEVGNGDGCAGSIFENNLKVIYQ